MPAHSRRRFLQTTALAVPALAQARLAPGDDAADIAGEIARRHDADVRKLQEWIRLPAIAAENRGMEEGCAFMMQLARDAGFQHVARVPTDGHPSVFATLDAGARAHRRPVLHVRREAGRPRGVDVAALRGRDPGQARPGQGRHGARRGQPEGPGDGHAGRAARHPRRREEGAGEPRAGRRGRGGDRFAALPPGGPAPRGRRRARARDGRVHARRGAGSRRRRVRRPRREGRGRAGAGGERREVGPRPGQGRALQPAGDAGQPRLPPRAGAGHAGHPRTGIPPSRASRMPRGPRPPPSARCSTPPRRGSSEGTFKKAFSVERWVHDLPWRAALERLSSRPP